MPAKKKPKQTHEDRAAKAKSKMHEELYKATWNRVQGVLKSNPKVLYNVEKMMVDEGYLQSMEIAGCPLGSPRFVSPTKDRSALPMLEDKPRGNGAGGSGGGGDSNGGGGSNGDTGTPIVEADPSDLSTWDDTPFNRNGSTFDFLGARFLEDCLELISPIACSKANLSAKLRLPAQRAVAKPKLAELLEYATKIKLTDAIEVQFRSKQGAARYIKEQYANEGDGRLENIHLPFNFEVNGVYVVVSRKGKTVTLKSRFTGVEITLKDVPEKGDLVICENWSERSAKLTVKGSSYRKELLPYFIAKQDDVQKSTVVNIVKGNRLKRKTSPIVLKNLSYSSPIKSTSSQLPASPSAVADGSKVAESPAVEVDAKKLRRDAAELEASFVPPIIG